jgi:hypothetical protein
MLSGLILVREEIGKDSSFRVHRGRSDKQMQQIVVLAREAQQKALRGWISAKTPALGLPARTSDYQCSSCPVSFGHRTIK